MTSASPLELQEFDIEHMATGIWSSVLGIEIHRCNVDDLDLDDVLTGVINITGDWRGTVVLSCHPGVARDAAATMGGLRPEDCTDEDLDDAACELTNMTAGGIKALLPGTCSISLPTVVRGANYEVAVKGGAQLGAYGFHSNRRTILIRVLVAPS